MAVWTLGHSNKREIATAIGHCYCIQNKGGIQAFVIALLITFVSQVQSMQVVWMECRM